MKVKCINQYGLGDASVTKPSNFRDLKQGRFISVICHMSIASYQDAPLQGYPDFWTQDDQASIWSIAGYHSRGKMKSLGKIAGIKHTTQRWHTSFLLRSYWSELVTGSTQHKVARKYNPIMCSNVRSKCLIYRLMTIAYFERKLQVASFEMTWNSSDWNLNASEC